MKQINFNIADINMCTEAEGPCKRLAIWFQGCDKRCIGCCNPELLDFVPAHFMTLGEVINVIVDAKEKFDIEGVTFLGGEPTLQRGLAELSLSIRSMGLGVILFTGRQFEELFDDLKTATDLIVDGSFEQDKIDNARNLVGSENQRIIFITERYRSHEQWFYIPRPKRVDINLSDGLFLTGDKV